MKKEIIRNRKKLDLSFNAKENVIKISKGNTFEHELAKFILCWEAIQNNKTFVTEAIFRNGKRADIFILDDNEAWEVLKSETRKYFESKKEEYPCKVIGFKSKDVVKYLKKYLE